MRRSSNNRRPITGREDSGKGNWWGTEGLTNLVPKLCLGTQACEALLRGRIPTEYWPRSAFADPSKQSFSGLRSQAELGNEGKPRVVGNVTAFGMMPSHLANWNAILMELAY
jgi:hypothetical protein